MKLGKPTLIYLIILITMLGASTVLVLPKGSEVKAKVKWRPKKYLLDAPVPYPWNAEIWLTGGHKRDEIDIATIRLEGTYSPSDTPTPAVHGPRLIVPFDGEVVRDLLLVKLPHIAPEKYRIPLEITGLLQDGTSFRGTGYIHLTVPENPSP